MSAVTPFGTWPSPLHPGVMASGARRITAPSFVREGAGATAMLWCESRPEQGGRTTIMRRAADGTTVELVPPPWDVGTRVHEYGGRAYVAWDGGVVFVHRTDQSVWRLRGTEVVPLLPPGSPRIAEPVVDVARDRLIAVAETLVDGGPPRASLVAIALGDGTVTELRAGADFYASPTLDASGTRLAWIEWSHPHMPWDAAAVHTGVLDDVGYIATSRHVAGDASASAQQPTWGPDGALYFLWEPDGAWTLWRERDGVTERIGAADDELGGPMWNLGMRTWGFVDGTTALAARIHDGVASVVAIDVARATTTTVCADLPSIGHLATIAGLAAVVEGWDGRGSALRLVDAVGATLYERDGGMREVLPSPWWSRPEAIRFATSDGDTAHAWFYPPHNPEHRGREGTAPPLVVVAHGGPTGVALASGNLPVQFWTTRGFAVLDVNYRGSTGFGRAYRERLRGMWGVYDVDDCVAAARHVATRGLVDPRRMIIRGASAGGFTALAALAFHDVFAAGASHYGVTDVASLVTDTHKFESHYDRFLFGVHDDPVAQARLWHERSPLQHAGRIAVPVIFFQGLDDPAVVPSQTERMVEALRSRGVEVEYRAYAGEGHGFRRAENVEDTWTRELAFHRRVLGLDGG